MGNSMCFGSSSDDDRSPRQVKIQSSHSSIEEQKKSDHIKNQVAGEQECHRILKEIFPNKTFSRCKPPFLLNSKLELDMYCPDLGLAVQYYGSQYYEYDCTYHKSLQEFTDFLRQNSLRVELCARNGINLVTIPYNIPNIRSYLIDVLGDQYRSEMTWLPSS